MRNLDASLKQLLLDLEQDTSQSLSDSRLLAVGGGDINRAYHLQTAQIDWFIKLNRPSLAAMFQAEAVGLHALAQTQTVKVPQVIHCGSNQDYAYLVLEYISLEPLRGSTLSKLGEQLAALHQIEQPFFGWFIDNTIGSTPQHNRRDSDWARFWQQQRLGRQLEFAANNGYGGQLQKLGEKLVKTVPLFFQSYQPHPSLLHGDLWGGNAAVTPYDEPVIFDPACYYGDREADLAMTELFGGFGQNFYAAYRAHYPLDSGYAVRKRLYNLYHILNHLNLFGRGYLSQATAMIERLLAEG